MVVRSSVLPFVRSWSSFQTFHLSSLSSLSSSVIVLQSWCSTSRLPSLELWLLSPDLPFPIRNLQPSHHEKRFQVLWRSHQQEQVYVTPRCRLNCMKWTRPLKDSLKFTCVWKMQSRNPRQTCLPAVRDRSESRLTHRHRPE
jgi:hypothetical protein